MLPRSALKTGEVPLRSEPKRSLHEGDVVSIQDKDGNYMTAWEDEMTVTWKEELQGSNNPQFWTLVEKGSETSIEGHWFHLKSIYGTFLSGELSSDFKILELCLKHSLSTKRYGSFTCSPWRLHDTSPWQPPNGFRFFCDGVGGAICLIWRIQLVNSEVLHSSKLGKHVTINFINQMDSNSRPGSTAGGGGSGLSSLYSTGQNVNGSGTQKTGDVNIKQVVGSYENVYIELN